MGKQKRGIERDKQGNLVKWYGFWVSDDIESEKCRLYFGYDVDSNVVYLFLYDDHIASIDYSYLVDENREARKVIHTENEIWAFIYKECRKCVGNRKIFVARGDVERGGIASTVAGNLSDFLNQKEKDLDEYFRLQEERYL